MLGNIKSGELSKVDGLIATPWMQRTSHLNHLRLGIKKVRYANFKTIIR